MTQAEAMMLMADTAVRLVVLEGLKLVVWLPALIGLIWLHAKLSK